MKEPAIAVLDASVLLALLLGESRAMKLTDEFLELAVVSTVNLAEVQSKLVKNGYDPEHAWEDANDLVPVQKLFTSEQAKMAGTLIAKTEKYCLSLGDRACLALAISLKAPVYTTEQNWRNLDLGIPIHVLR